ncbi:transketolase C-terminal domain-containing protein [Clostridioides difficile]
MGKGTVFREGKDVSIIDCGIMANEALLAQVNLLAECISAIVINM